MDYQGFVIAVTNEVNERLEEGMIAQVHTITKNNGKEKTGLTIVQRQINISPTIYLEEYYDMFKEGDDLEEIADQIVRFYEHVKFEKSWDGDFLKSYKSIENRVLFKVINYKKNRKFLDEVPHMRFMDLAITFYILLESAERGTATITVRNEHLEMWGVTTGTLYRASQRNCPRLLPAELSTMRSVVESMLLRNWIYQRQNILTVEDAPLDDTMFVLSNDIRNYGASCMFYDSVLEMVGDKLQENFYILPSSVHEVIIVPESKSVESVELNAMIKEINETQVDETEVLSDHTYYFDCKRNIICM